MSVPGLTGKGKEADIQTLDGEWKSRMRFASLRHSACEMEIKMLDAILDSLIDSLKLLPFLFLTYLAMEYLESRTGEKTKHFIRKAGRLGPLWGSLLGIVPQCGFSAAAANLYAGRVITMGTLLAVFLSTSDEMLPIMISERTALPVLLHVLAAKVVIALIAGFVVDFCVHFLLGRKGSKGSSYADTSHTGKGHAETGHTGTAHTGALEKVHTAIEAEEDYQIERLCEHEHCHCHDGSIVKSALKHTMNIFFFILLISLVLNIVLTMIGEETLIQWAGERAVYGEFLAALLGLIPNCASSVVITQLYLRGVFGASQLISGLLVGAGVGVLVLFRVNPDTKENIKLTALLYVIGVLGGMAVRALGIAF